MAQWPPSPIVEDEEASLAKEYLLEKNVQRLKTENQPVPSRGSVDQYPIIVESDTQGEKFEKNSTTASSAGHSNPRRGRSIPDMSSSQKNPDPLTPPSSDNEAKNTPRRPAVTTATLEPEVHVPRSKSTTRLDERASSRGRPPISRIKTDLDDALPRANTRIRRSSPYSYTKETGTFKVEPKDLYLNEAVISSVHASLPQKSAPVSSNTGNSETKYQGTQSGAADRDHQSPRQIRFSGDLPRGSEPLSTSDHHAQVKEPHPPEVVKSRQHGTYTETLTPPSSRKQSRESPLTSGVEEKHRSHRTSSHHHSHRSETVRESPYASSAEESVKSERIRSDRKHVHHDSRPRHHSSHRRERPQFDEPFSQIGHQSPRHQSDDDSARSKTHAKDRRSFVVSPLSGTPQAMEEYFSQAFKDNEKRSAKPTKRLSNDYAVLSPPTSPPRTPRTDRRSGQDYFGTASPSSQRSQPRSRQPSLEDTQIRDLKAHTSLLSQATVGAAIAARVAPPLSRSSSTSIETTSSNPGSKPSSGQRSRRPSPVPEEPRPVSRSDSFTYGEETHVVRHPPVVQDRSRPSTRDGPPPPVDFGSMRASANATVHSRPSTRDGPVSIDSGFGRCSTFAQDHSRPSTRDGPVHIESSINNDHLQPQRNGSYTGYEHRPQRSHPAHFGPLLTPGAAVTGNLSPQVGHLPPIHRSMSAATPAELARPFSNDLVLPHCPRPQPTRGLRDWSTFRDISNIDICPSCADAILATRYRAYVVRGLEKAASETIVCAMSRPWIRIAFAHSLKYNEPDLKLVKDVSTLPENVRPCNGPNKDVRVWWTMKDPLTDKPIPDFHACSACIVFVDVIFPKIKNVFIRDASNQENICSLQHTSKHFPGFVDQLEQANERVRIKGSFRPRLMQPLADHVRKVLRYPECAKDTLLKNRAWHYMSDLPEFTICEECFEEVVWPIREKPIARDISQTIKIPSSKVGGQHGISCQLYSERMRKIFHDAVATRNLDHLKMKAKERYAAQHRLHEMNKMYEDDEKLGWDRRAEIQKNKDIWKSMA